MMLVATSAVLSTLRAELATVRAALAAREQIVRDAAVREHAFDAAHGEVYDLDAHVGHCLSDDVACSELAGQVCALTTRIEREEDALDTDWG